MGPPERLNLRWADFEANARLSLRKLRDEREFNDVTVVADCGKQVEANKMVLAGGSSFFHKILKENLHAHPLIYLKGVGYKHLVYLLDFVYTGETSIVEDDLNDFLDIAQDLKVKGLTMPGTLEPCPSTRVSYPQPQSVTSATPAPRQDQVATEERDPSLGMVRQPRPQSRTSSCPASRPSQVFAEEASTAAVTQLHTVELAAKEAAQPVGMQRPKSAMSSHLDSAFSQDSCEEDHDVEGNIHIDEVIVLSAEQDQNENFISKEEIMESSDKMDEEADDWYEQGEEIDNMTIGMYKHDKNKIPDGEKYFADQTKSSEDTDYQCSLCSITFTTSSQLRRHRKSHMNENRSEMSSQMGSSDKMKRNHAVEKPLQCVHCPKSSSHVNHLKLHKMAHTREKWHQCDLCPKSFSQLGNLKQHKMIHTGEKSHQCVECPKSFSQLISLKRHKMTHTGEKPHQCDLCTKSFSQLCNLKLHKMTHTGEKPHQCDMCTKSFSLLRSLKLHKMTHTGDKPHQCDMCPKSFSHLGNLKRHKMIHTGEKSHQCDLCSKSFSQVSSLKRHKMIHTGEKPHQCDLCTISFSQLAHLKKHKMTHTGEKPHQCADCPKTFSEVCNLKRHKMTHTGEKPHQCNLCTKSFSLLAHLKRHERIHTGEKPFQCDLCSKSFSQIGTLKLHKMSHSQKPPH